MADHPQRENLNLGMGRFIQYAIVVLVIALLALVYFFVRDYRALRRAQVINARELLLTAIVRNHGHLNAGDIAVIRSWMTFDYVDQLFGTPADYVKTQLSIGDPRYPNLTLSGYAKNEHVSSAAVVVEVEHAITLYFASSTPTNMTPTGL